MLSSPGHSPRHVSPPPPPSSKTTSDHVSKKRQRVILDEESYVAAIEKIVERDYFPDIPKLRDRLDWLEALRSRDPSQIRDAQLKILERRSNQGKSRTPASNSRSFSSSITPFDHDFDSTPLISSKDQIFRSKDDSFVNSSLSLDGFFRKYTSEDNESFNRILEKVNLKRREKVVHFLERDGENPQLRIEGERKKEITDGFGSSGQPEDSLIGWKYKAKNLLMYYPADQGELPLTDEELSVRIKGLSKEISLSNTRFRAESSLETKSLDDKPDRAPVLYGAVPVSTPAGASWPFSDREAEKSRKYDLEDLRKTPNQFYVESEKDPVKGYSFVKTPSPAPGADESPFMTWGEIEGTPLRLDLDETAAGSADGPRFSIPLPPTRDVKAHSLSRDAARKLREKSRMYQRPPLPSPARSGSASPSLRTLSPAAQKFMRKAFAKSSRSIDETLRASYRGSSPVVGTPRERTATRFSKEGSLGTMSPSASQGPLPP